VKVPQVGLPGPRILDLYVSRVYVRVFALASVGMLGIFYIATFIDLSDKLFKGQTTSAMLVRYFWYATPQFVYFVVPIGALLATLVTVGLLTKSSELVVMRAVRHQPVPDRRALAPVRSLLERRALRAAGDGARPREPPGAGDPARGPRRVAADVRRAEPAVGRRPRRQPVQLRLLRSPGRGAERPLHLPFRRPRVAPRVAHLRVPRRLPRGHVAGPPGWQREFDRRSEVRSFKTFDSATLALEPADYFKTEQPDAERMNYAQLRHYIDELKTSGFNVVPYAVALQRKVSFPFVTIVMTLLAVPFAVTTGAAARSTASAWGSCWRSCTG